MKEYWKAGNMLYPVPPVMVTTQTKDGFDNVFTVAWCGTICTNPAMLSISVRKERYSYQILQDTKEFVVNIPSKTLAYACDYVGVKSGRDHDKIKELGLKTFESKYVKPKSLEDSPINIECSVENTIDLGSHTMFIAKVLGVTVDNKYMDENGKFDLKKADVITYSHGEYYTLGENLGKFGFSVKKRGKNEKIR